MTSQIDDTLDFWGSQLLVDKQRRQTWLAQFMLGEGTTPEPIIIASEAKGVSFPIAGLATSGRHLVEGHMRLAYLRGMSAANVPTLKPDHRVWLLTA